MRTILHIDFDSFFASVEQQEHKEFRGKPLGVTAAHSRTCIIAASREAKTFGVITGSRAFEAYKKCPFLLLTPAHFTKYYEVSKKFLMICQRFSPYIEVFSIDELFMDVTRTAVLFGGVERLIRFLKEAIKQEIGEYITISVGVSHNKLLAKVASGLHKPDGIVMINPDDVETVYRMIALTDICGIGFRIARRLQMMGVFHPIDLRRVSEKQLAAEFGTHEARFLSHIAWARDETAVVTFGNSQTIKSVGRNYCLPKNEDNQRIILQRVFALCEEIGTKLRKLHKKARGIGFSLRGERNELSRHAGKIYMDNGRELFEHCFTWYHQWQWNEMVRQISVWVFHLEDSTALPVQLFPFEQKYEKAIHCVDAINDRFGKHTIYSGFLLYADKLTTVPNGFLADKLERTELASMYIR
ncbi:MAG TPA: hypothetical protein VGT05_03895 [Patescibacteria group bacterium]|nr:hypothetical protein [Patescibacteria group bacterium]